MINAVEALVRVRERIHDFSARTFDDPEILRALDDCVRRIFTILRTHGDAINRDSVDIPVASLTQVHTNVYEWKRPEYVADIKMVKLVTSVGGTDGYQVPRASLEEQDHPFSYVAINRRPVWLPGPRDTVQLRGPLVPFAIMRVTFVRKIPPLVYGDQSVSSSTQLTPATVVGAWKARDDLYVMSNFEMVDGPAANVGQVRMCTAFTGGVITLDPALPAAADTTTDWAMVLPLPDEYHEYLIALATMTMFRREGAADEMELLRPELDMLQHEFESGISRQTSGEPPRLSSSRRGGLR